MSQFFSLGKSDIVKAMVVAVLTVVLGALQQALAVHGLDVMAYDWVGIADLAWKTAGVYIIKNVLTAENGKVFGAIG